MIKKALCIFLAMITILGTYAVIPSSVNPLPVTEVSAATRKKQRSYAGAYKAKTDVYVMYNGMDGGTFFVSYRRKQGSIIELNDQGYVKEPGQKYSMIRLKFLVDYGSLVPMYRSHKMVYID